MATTIPAPDGRAAPYAKPFAAKLETESALRRSSLPFTILRPSNFTESVAGDFVDRGVANLARSGRGPVRGARPLRGGL
jgi:uncharacterized protein YbjT (DUF2867 family)